jgi:3-oxoacyl-(acyl-carrier-protein) synthase
MTLRGWIVGLAFACASISLALAQSGLEKPSGDQQYVPQLSDLMNSVQTRHIKLWLSARAQNWDLARFELSRLRASLTEAALLYSGIPVSNVTTLGTSLQSIEEATDAKDSKRFAASFAGLTDGCNACHSGMSRGFIVIRTPTEQPFGNQLFAPQGKH